MCLSTHPFVTESIRLKHVRAIGQAVGEGLDEHPTITDPMEGVLTMSKIYRALPDSVLNLEPNLYDLWVAWNNGYMRGQEIRAKRGK